jgi:hypothetical protein
LDGIGWQHDRGRVLRFLHNPAVIARKVSHCSKNGRGAEAFAVFASLARTAVKQGSASVTGACLRLMQNTTTAAPT